MIAKKGWLKDAEARLTGLYIKGKKVKGVTLTQAEVDAWNGTAKPAPAPVVEEVVVEEEVVVVEEAPAVEVAEEEAPVKTTKKKATKKKSLFGK